MLAYDKDRLLTFALIILRLDQCYFETLYNTVKNEILRMKLNFKNEVFCQNKYKQITICLKIYKK